MLARLRQVKYSAAVYPNLHCYIPQPPSPRLVRIPPAMRPISQDPWNWDRSR